MLKLSRNELYFKKMFRDLNKTDIVAAICADEELSYKELYRYSNAVSFLTAGKKDKSPVVIWGDKENEILPCMYGCLLGGHPYTFIPSHYPADRISDIMEDCGSTTVLAVGRGEFPAKGDFDLYDRDALMDIFVKAGEDELPAEYNVGYDDIWVIYYTSGSTGKPKGVTITGENIATKVEMIQPYFGQYFRAPGVRVLNLSSYAFSISMTLVYSDIAALGTTLISIPSRTLRDYPKLFEILLSTDPTGFSATPSLVELFMKDDRYTSEHLPSMQYFCFGGEPLNASTAKKLMERFPDMDVYNGYGATETIAAPFIFPISRDYIGTAEGIVPVGLDDGYGDHRIVGADGSELPDGEVGELVTAGGYVSPGYLNRPDANAQKFFKNENGVQSYRTGDMMYRKDGCFYFKGRKDNMVKVGGYRVELEDVESNLRKIDIVKNCCSVPVMDGDSVIMLAAYIVLRDPSMSKIAAIKEIKTQMAGLVQEYMVPQRIKIVDELPYNNSNKVDRARLTAENRIN